MEGIELCRIWSGLGQDHASIKCGTSFGTYLMLGIITVSVPDMSDSTAGDSHVLFLLSLYLLLLLTIGRSGLTAFHLGHDVSEEVLANAASGQSWTMKR
jgi:hypothetical protein